MNDNHTNISDLREGQSVHELLLIDNIRPSVTRQGNSFYFAEVKDATGKMSAVCWEPDGSVTDAQNGTIVTVIGTVGSYNGQLQICIESAAPVDPADVSEDVLHALVPSAPIDLEEYKQALADLIASIRDGEIRDICEYTLRCCWWEEFTTYPAAKSCHHAFRYGLLMHSVDMARLAEQLLALKPGCVNRDLLIAGILLHDVGKVTEFAVSPVTGLVTGYTAAGNLVGHSVLGAQEIEEAAAVVGARSEAVQLLKHMVLAHHGDPNCGAAKEPATIEAELLHALDLLDSRRQIYVENLALTPEGEFSAKIFALGRAIYHHTLAASPAAQKEV